MRHPDSAFLRFLVEDERFNVNALVESELPLLSFACLLEDLPKAKILLSNPKCDPNLRKKYYSRELLLTHCIRVCDEDPTVMQIYRYPPVELDTSKTPLSFACFRNSFELVEVLLSHPRIEVTRANIWSSIKYGRGFKQKAIVKHLCEHPTLFYNDGDDFLFSPKNSMGRRCHPHDAVGLACAEAPHLLPFLLKRWDVELKAEDITPEERKIPLVAKYLSNYVEGRKEAQLLARWDPEDAARVFALMIFFQDGLLSLRDF